MEKKENQTSSPGEIQVFELTMDNPEDQDELNRHLRKPDKCLPAQIGGASQGESAIDSPKNS